MVVPIAPSPGAALNSPPLSTPRPLRGSLLANARRPVVAQSSPSRRPVIAQSRGITMLPLVLWFALVSADEPAPAYLIRGATIHDGSGQARYRGDVPIGASASWRWAKFWPRRASRGSSTAQGLIVAPGFIDLHTHSDTPHHPQGDRANLNYLTQGVTTVVTGNCGCGPVDVAALLQEDRRGQGRHQRHPPGAAQRGPATGHGQRQPPARRRRS